jgi:hypothetical protein
MASGSRNAAYAAISINWKQMRPDLYYTDESRDERLEWIGKFLGIKNLESMTDLSDDQLGAVAGEMKRLTGHAASPKPQAPSPKAKAAVDNVVAGHFGGDRHTQVITDDLDGNGETIFLSSAEMVYTLEKLLEYIAWTPDHRESFLISRFGTSNLRMLTFKKAKVAVNTFLRIAAHRDLKVRNGADKPVSRKAIDKYIPALKRELGIDQRK